MLACLYHFGSVSPVSAQDSFYKGESIRLIVGSTPGGFYDRWARFSQIYSRQSGNIRSEHARSGLLDRGQLRLQFAKPDGLTLAMVQYNIYMDQLVGRKEVQFEVGKFSWIGSPASESVLLYMRNDAPYRSIQDIIKAKEPAKCGSSGTVSTDYLLARLLEDAIGAKFNTVIGYPGGF